MKLQPLLSVRKGQKSVTEKTKKSKWGLGIFLLYGLFVIFILSLVMFASVHDVQLVEKNYYQKDLAYQDQIDRVDRTSRLEKKLTMDMSGENGNIKIKFPVGKNKIIEGTIKFFRPSNSRYDFEIPIKADSLGTQEIDTKLMIRGFWKVNLNWKVDSIEYYQQEPLMIN